MTLVAGVTADSLLSLCVKSDCGVVNDDDSVDDDYLDNDRDVLLVVDVSDMHHQVYHHYPYCHLNLNIYY